MGRPEAAFVSDGGCTSSLPTSSEDGWLLCLVSEEHCKYDGIGSARADALLLVQASSLRYGLSSLAVAAVLFICQRLEGSLDFGSCLLGISMGGGISPS